MATTQQRTTDPFAQVDLRLVWDPNITDTEFRVLSALIGETRVKGGIRTTRVKLSVSSLAKALRRKRDTIQAALDGLAEKRVVMRVQETGRAAQHDLTIEKYLTPNAGRLDSEPDPDRGQVPDPERGHPSPPIESHKTPGASASGTRAPEADTIIINDLNNLTPTGGYGLPRSNASSAALQQPGDGGNSNVREADALVLDNTQDNDQTDQSDPREHSRPPNPDCVFCEGTGSGCSDCYILEKMRNKAA